MIDYITDSGKLIYKNGLFEFTMRIKNNTETCDPGPGDDECECEECKRYKHGPCYCRLYVKNGKVMVYDEDITFRHFIRRYNAECTEEKNPGYAEFEELCSGNSGAQTGLIEYYEAKFYIRDFMHFEKHILANYKPTGRFTKPAMH